MNPSSERPPPEHCSLFDEDFRRYSWATMLAHVGTYEKPDLDRMGRPKDHGQQGVASERQASKFNDPAKRSHPFHNYHFTNYL